MSVYLITNLKTDEKKWFLAPELRNVLDRTEDIPVKDIRLITEDEGHFVANQKSYDRLYMGGKK